MCSPENEGDPFKFLAKFLQTGIRSADRAGPTKKVEA